MCKEELLTLTELAEKLKVSRWTIYKWQKEGIPTEIHNPARFKYEDVKQWLEEKYERENGIQKGNDGESMQEQRD